MKKVLLIIGTSLLAGCIPGTIPSVNTGNTTTEEAPDVKTNSDQRAPVFNITVYANPAVRASGGNMTEGTMGQPGPVTAPEELAPVVPSPTSLRLSEMEPLAPLNKGGEPTLVGRTFGGMTLEEYNRSKCMLVEEEERVEPIASVWEGCRPYWEKGKPSSLQGG